MVFLLISVIAMLYRSDYWYHFLGAVAAVIAFLLWLRFRRSRAVAFFHPYAEGAGGGERVLFLCIRAAQELAPDLPIVVYTGLTAESGEQIIKAARERFELPEFKQNIRFVRLRSRVLLEAWLYPRLTLVLQMIGSMVVSFEALLRFTPMVYIDTTGYAFTYPFARIIGCRVGCYTHYPTVSTDMIGVVEKGVDAHNNSRAVAQSRVLSFIKVCYYKIFAIFYGMVGRVSSLIMVNSSWTRGHIATLWKVDDRAKLVYPPCDTAALSALDIEKPRAPLVLSIGQFRPEKDQALQIRAFARLVGPGTGDAGGADDDTSSGPQRPRLVLLGGCRNKGDRKRVEELRALAKTLGVADAVDFEVDAPFARLRELLGQASVGIHTMWNEHFGISVVEFMAAGVIPVAHASGGPKMDIVVPAEGKGRVGYLADSEEGYTAAMREVLDLDPKERARMRRRARKQSKKFSSISFLRTFTKHFEALIKDL